MALRDYAKGDMAALMALCQGTCYWPDCLEPVVRFVDKKPVVNLQISHIRAAKPDGPRFDPNMSDADRKSFGNLILLCHPHHFLVDRLESEKYAVGTLIQWKRQRESSGEVALAGLRGVSEEKLQQLVSEAVSYRDDKIADALSRLEQSDREAAQLLRKMVDELAQLRYQGPAFSEDAAMMLGLAADKLHLNSDTIEMLDDIADRLQLNDDMLIKLNKVADRLIGLQ